MLRKILTIALPLLAPFVLYWIYLTFSRRNAQAAGAGQVPRWQEGPWIWLALSGVVLMAAALIAFGLSSGVEPGTQIIPPRMIDGEVAPSRPASP